MKMMCKCGNVITDNTDNLGYKAEFTKDQDIEKRFEAFNVMADFIQAVNDAKREEWIRSFYKNEEIATTLTNGNILSDIFLKHDNAQNFYQCNSCGRLLVPNTDNNLLFFYPEDHDNKNILSTKP